MLKNNVEYQGHLKVKVTMLQVGEKDLSNNVCEYEVNRLTNAKVIRGKLNFNAARPGFTNLEAEIIIFKSG